MGKPAARLGDTTAHGGTLILGNPTLMVGKMPASTLGDMQVCPMCTGPVPHVGGPVSLGSMGVMLGKKPGARISDMSVCVGPPSMPAMGCMTVLIGEPGSGSQAGSAAAAAAAQAAKTKATKAIEAFPLGEPPPTTENHDIQVEFTDSAGKPLSGVIYDIKDPDGAEIRGASTMDGSAFHGGYAKKGSFELTVKSLVDVKWDKAEAGMKDTIKFSAKADAFKDGEAATVMIVELCGGMRQKLEEYPLKVSGEKISGEWTWKKAYLPPANEPPRSENPTFIFIVVCGGHTGVSGPLKLSDKMSVKVEDGEGTAKKQMDYELHLSNGEVRKGKLDDAGTVKAEGLPPGNHKIKLVQPEKQPKAKAAEKAPAPKAKYSGFGDLKEAEREQEEAEKKKAAEDPHLLKKGDTGPIVEELNLRLLGFGGGTFSQSFDEHTEKRVKKFRTDYMAESNPVATVDKHFCEKLDEFSAKFSTNFDHIKCKCGHCQGFGKGDRKDTYREKMPKVEAYHEYEYPGVHRGLIWISKSLSFYMGKECPDRSYFIESGFRCWNHPLTVKNRTTNHLGKALDIHITVNHGGHWAEPKTKDERRTECDNIRLLIKKHCEGQIGWSGHDKVTVEPGDISPVWVHFDLRMFDPKKYLLDKFFVKGEKDADGEPMASLWDKK